MRVEDLRIGNIITDEHGFQMHVVGIGKNWVTADFEGNEGDVWEFDFKYSFPKPIEITEEILLKCGFEKEILEPKHYYIEGMRIWKCNDMFLCDKNGIHIKYLHQLQNLYWCLCGEELEINL